MWPREMWRFLGPKRGWYEGAKATRLVIGISEIGDCPFLTENPYMGVS